MVSCLDVPITGRDEFAALGGPGVATAEAVLGFVAFGHGLVRAALTLGQGTEAQ